MSADLHVCFTGHRESKLPQGAMRKVIVSMLYLEIQSAIADGATVFYTGMADGVDLDAAELVLEQKITHPMLRLIAVLPFPKKQLTDVASDCRYQRILQAADEVVTLCPAYRRGCYEMRNQYMVDHSERVIAVCREMRSGTGQTIRMAKQKGIEVRVIEIDKVEKMLTPSQSDDICN